MRMDSKGQTLDTYRQTPCRQTSISKVLAETHFCPKVRFLHGVLFNVDTEEDLPFHRFDKKRIAGLFPSRLRRRQERKITRILGGGSLLGIFHRCETLWIVETSCEVFRRLYHAFENTSQS